MGFIVHTNDCQIFENQTRKYYDDKNIYVQEGVFRKQYSSFPLIKIENIHMTSNILGNGTIKLSVRAGNYPHLKIWSLCGR